MAPGSLQWGQGRSCPVGLSSRCATCRINEDGGKQCSLGELCHCLGDTLGLKSGTKVRLGVKVPRRKDCLSSTTHVSLFLRIFHHAWASRAASLQLGFCPGEIFVCFPPQSLFHLQKSLFLTLKVLPVRPCSSLTPFQGHSLPFSIYTPRAVPFLTLCSSSLIFPAQISTFPGSLPYQVPVLLSILHQFPPFWSHFHLLCLPFNL